MIKIYNTYDYPKELKVNSLKNQNFDAEKFDRSILTNLNMSFSSFYNCDFRSAELKCTILENSDLQKAKLIMVEAMWIKLNHAILKEALLLQSNFSFGSFFESNLEGAMIKNSNFSFCDLRGANFNCDTIENCNFKNSIYNFKTKWPNDFIPEQQGAIYQKEKMTEKDQEPWTLEKPKG